jgi:secreted Zn-dependent insulinase-like peptidase
MAMYRGILFMKNEPHDLVKMARKTQYEMTEGFYDQEVREKDAHFIEMDKNKMTATQRNKLEKTGAELAAMAGVSQEAAESAFFGLTFKCGIERISKMTPQERAEWAERIKRKLK